MRVFNAFTRENYVTRVADISTNSEFARVTRWNPEFVSRYLGNRPHRTHIFFTQLLKTDSV